MTDHSMSELLQNEGECVQSNGKYGKLLQNLHTFIVRGRHCGGDIALSESTIGNLMSNCNDLETIGDCSTWSISQNLKYSTSFS